MPRARLLPRDELLLAKAVLVYLAFVAFVFLQSVVGTRGALLVPGSVNPYETRDAAFQLLFHLFFFLLCLDFFKTRGRLQGLVILLAAQVTFLVALGAYQSLALHTDKIYGIYKYSHNIGIYSSFVNANHYGGYLAMAVFPLLGTFIYTCDRFQFRFRLDPLLLQSLYFILLIALCAFSMFHAGARGAFLVSVGMIAFFWLVMVFPKHKAVTLAVLAGFALVFAAALLAIGSDQLESYSKLPSDFLKRLEGVREASKMFGDRPLFGWGIGTFKWLSRRYQWTAPEIGYRSSANNDFVELLAEAGLLGFLLFLLPIFWLTLTSIQRCAGSRSRWSRAMGFSLAASTATLAVLSSIDHYLKTPAVAMLFTALFAALFRTASLYDERSADPPVVPAANRWLKRAVALALLLSAVHTLAHYRAQKILDASWRYQALYRRANADIQKIRRAPDEDLRLLKKAAMLRPLNAEGWAVYGKACFDKGKLGDPALMREAREAFARSAMRAPTWPDAWAWLGRSEIRLGDEALGLSHLARGMSLMPHNRDAHLYMILMYLKHAALAKEVTIKSAYRQKALQWLQKTSRLPRPLTRQDHGYIVTYDHFKGKTIQLSELEEKRLQSLFSVDILPH